MIIPSQPPMPPSTSLEDYGGRPFPAPANPQILAIAKVSLINRSFESPRQTKCTLCGASACMTAGGTCCNPTTGISALMRTRPSLYPGLPPTTGMLPYPGPMMGITILPYPLVPPTRGKLGLDLHLQIIAKSHRGKGIHPNACDSYQQAVDFTSLIPYPLGRLPQPSMTQLYAPRTRPNAAVISAQGASTPAPASIQSATSGVSSASSTPTATNTPSPSSVLVYSASPPCPSESYDFRALSPLSAPQIVAVTVGGFAALGFFVWILWYFFQRARKRIHSESQLDPDRDELLPKVSSLEISPVDSHPRSASRATIMTETRSLSSPVTPY
ncbi:hypothetical protein BOTBODRAFT_42579 [Botryobasidium botryosum FD-172 SS1]|uniref:Uncharacterized protein n=1 Tax=Botryobasidium botryosum (strain FD-172 SS1) TaxID=930990 RepID=A0A067N309_BOTB1|nr:hypothetical protein BOTBODRAFT_42579 [Botryobasidium botryosum FD-172 SS1]